MQQGYGAKRGRKNMKMRAANEMLLKIIRNHWKVDGFNPRLLNS